MLERGRRSSLEVESPRAGALEVAFQAPDRKTECLTLEFQNSVLPIVGLRVWKR